MVEYRRYQDKIEDFPVFGTLDDEWLAFDYIQNTQTFSEDKCHPGTYSINYKAYQDAYITIFKSILYINGEPDCIFEQTITHSPEILIKLQEEKQKKENIINGLVEVLKQRGYTNITTKQWFEEPYWTDNNEWEITTTVDAVFPIAMDSNFRDGIAILEKEVKDLSKCKPHPYGCFMFKNEKVLKHIGV